MVKPPRLRTAYDHYYQDRRWRARRKYHLMRHPNCAMCEKRGVVTPATCCDHLTPHKGVSWLVFISAPIQSLCDSCHSGPKRSMERVGFSREIGLNGLPTDPNHPAYRSERHVPLVPARSEAVDAAKDSK